MSWLNELLQWSKEKRSQSLSAGLNGVRSRVRCWRGVVRKDGRAARACERGAARLRVAAPLSCVVLGPLPSLALTSTERRRLRYETCLVARALLTGKCLPARRHTQGHPAAHAIVLLCPSSSRRASRRSCIHHHRPSSIPSRYQANLVLNSECAKSVDHSYTAAHPQTGTAEGLIGEAMVEVQAQANASARTPAEQRSNEAVFGCLSA